MFYLRYLFQNLRLTLKLIRQGQWHRVYLALHARLYVALHNLWFCVKAPWLRSGSPARPDLAVRVETDHPVAFSSPDHQVPFGTKYNNTTNRKFVALMHERFRRQFPGQPLAFLDLGCSGGQLVADFARLQWVAVGLEGSDYSLKHRRANWKTLAGKSLFTCDIARPFRVKLGQDALKFHLVTAWDVMEHIHPDDLAAVFNNIREHLAEGGYFVATTNSSASIVNGVELHQTRMTNTQWREFIQQQFPDLEPADLGLRIHQYVRFDFGEPSFLVYQKKASASP
jgi:SAM-dependent methyltransferase